VAELKQDLREQGFELRETHISQVFLGQELVYKVKRPVALGFLDFRTLADRERFCQAEVELNQRLAPTVYRGVVPIVRDAQGVHRIGLAGEPVEWAVVMRRLPDRDSAEQRLREGRLGQDDLQRIAERVARFHRDARCDAETTRHGAVAAIEANVRENFAQTAASAPEYLGASELAAVERWQLDFLRERRARFESRATQGRIRDGHGDLRLEHCYLDAAGAVEIIDCIEFNERFRYGDVCADIAFLSMDLSWHGRADLSESLLADYARESGDYDLYGVVDFYESYRAFVRGKVSSLLAADVGADAAVRARARAEARKYYLLAEACTREPLAPPAVYGVSGVIASGKSTVARALGARIGAPVVDADRVRKQLAGVGPTTPLADAPFAAHYTPEASERVYAELLRRAEVVLESRRPVVVEASFREAEQRRALADLARRHATSFRLIECTAPPEVSRERLRRRAAGPSVSDGRAEVFDAFVASYEPVRELPAQAHLQLATDRPLADTIDELARWLELAPA